MAGAIDEYIQWKKKNEAVGCLFARLVASKGSDVGAYHIGVMAKENPSRIARSIHNAVTKAKNDSDYHAIAVVMPNLLDLSTLYLTFKALGAMEGWALMESEIEHEGVLYTAFQLTLLLQREDGQSVPSESLVLGPFEEFPNTRQAPVTAFEIFVGVPPGHDAMSGEPTQRARAPTHNFAARF